MISHAIEPYIFGSNPVDFFFPLFVNIPFSFYVYFLKKNHFLDYAHLREAKKKYIKLEFLSFFSFF